MLVGLLGSFTSIAQEKTDSIMTGLEFKTIIISANRWEQLRGETPMKVLSISSKEVLFENPQTAADMLGESGEIFIQKSQQSGGSPMIRGFATNRLLMSVDGVRMNTAIFRSGNIQNVISLDPLAIEHTEVLFGPGSVMYGSDAIGGVMYFATLKPQFSTAGKPLITGKGMSRFSSANNEITGHFDVNIGGKRFASVTSFSYSRFSDLCMGTNGPSENYLRPFYVQRINNADAAITNENPLLQVGTAYSQMNLMQKLAYKVNNHLQLTYAFHYSTSSDNNRYDNLIRTNKTGDKPRSAEWYYGPQDWMMNHLNITHTQKNIMYDEMNINLAHQFFEESRHDRDFGKTELRNRIEKVNAFSANFDFSKSLNEKHHLFYGLEMVYDDVNSTGTNQYITANYNDADSTVAGPSRYPMSNWQSYAAYVNYEYKISEKVILSAGARYNLYLLNAEFDTTFYKFPYTNVEINNGNLTGNLGIIYHPEKSWSLGVNLSTGFRSPNVDDMGKVFDSQPHTVMVPNPDLKAEYAYNGEVTLAKTFGNFLRIDITGFYTQLQDAMVRRDFTFNGQDSMLYDGNMCKVQAVQNAANAHVYGIEAGFELKLPNGIEALARINYQKGEEEQDDGTTTPLRHAAPLFGTAHFTYVQKKFKLDFYLNYSAQVSYGDMTASEQSKTYMYAVDGNGNPYSPAWYTLNLKAMYRFTDSFTLNAGIENITDQRYRPYSSGMVSGGRNFVVSAVARF